jgi:hypothetical protein
MDNEPIEANATPALLESIGQKKTANNRPEPAPNERKANTDLKSTVFA